ncbi:MAG: hypothetical protein P8J87_17110, partial [Verrucomicrobiales bacterium]|nr:hypothetical protein [Verrucomicrobiales bacterium]
MTKTELNKSLAVLLGLTVAPAAFGQFNAIEYWGDAATDGAAQGGPAWTAPATESGDFSITAGGADFWGNNDQAAFAYNNAGAYSTTGDFTATVRLVNVAGGTASNGWGRSGLLARGTEGTGLPQANDAHLMGVVRSNNNFTGGWRDTRGGGTGRSNDGVAIPDITNTAIDLAIGRSGNTIYASFKPDGATRWQTNASIRDVPGLAAGEEATVGFGHQAHNLDAPLSGNDANTVNATGFTWSNTFSPANFDLDRNATAGPVRFGAGGAVTGTAYYDDGGNVGAANWSLTATKLGAKVPGLRTDIYLAGNAGSQAGNRAQFGSPDGSLVIPNVNWTGGSDNDANYGGLTGSASFAVAVQGVDPADGTAGAFSGNQDSYGAHMQGEIWIPGDATRGGVEAVSFKDGIDDYTFVAVDGATLVDDNAWTGYAGNDNNGSPIATLDVSDPKFDDGEWVSFEMIMWEGGGGDNGVLYWDVANGDFPAANGDPAGAGAVVPGANFRHSSVESV